MCVVIEIGSVVVDKLLEMKDEKLGFDVMSGKIVNMMQSGIIDPAKVLIFRDRQL